MNKKTVSRYVAEGFVEKTVTMLVRKNGKYLQVVVEKDGKELLFIMQSVDSHREVRREHAPAEL